MATIYSLVLVSQSWNGKRKLKVKSWIADRRFWRGIL